MKNRIIKITQNYYQEHKKFPPLNKLGNKLGLTPDGLRTLLRELEVDGIIRRHNSRYYLSEWFNRIEVKKIAPPAPVKNVTPIKKVSNPFLAGVFFFLSVGAFIFSTYYSYLYLGKFMNGLPGLGLSLLFVVCSSMGFLTAKILWNKKHYFLSITMSLLGGITMVFSMFCTVAGLYELKHDIRSNNQHIDLVIDKNKELKKLYESTILEYTDSIKSKESEISVLQDKIKSSQDNKQMNVFIWRMGNIQKDLTPLQEQKKQTENLLRDLLLQIIQEPQRSLTIYESISKNILTKWNPNTLEFTINLFPVLLIDFLATFGPLIFSIFIDKKED